MRTQTITLPAELAETIEDWWHYHQQHGDIPYALEWARDIAQDVAKALEGGAS